MFLKRLDIKGFKSFADKTEICLEPGINIIVGPNGCGKSNVVDAIRWVLGEGNVRHLRGLKSEDVIFNGTDKTKGQGMAWVEMTLDNSDELLPVAFNEVTVTRKAFRSGESEFYLNRTRVRMKDVGELFTGTGLGKKGYSIINQGELEQVLNGQPLDRRLMLEEAAGIIKYRQQRDEVNRRIQNTGHDLLRLSDIINELSERRQELQTKAEKARLFTEWSHECQQKEKSVFCFDRSRLQRELQKKQADLAERMEALASCIGEMAANEEHLEQEEQQLRAAEQNLNQLKDKRREMESRLSALQGDDSITGERLKNRKERIETAEADARKYGEMLQTLQQDLKRQELDWEQENEAYQAKNAEYAHMESDLSGLELMLDEERREFEQKKAEVFTKVQSESQLKNELLAANERLRKLHDKNERLLVRVDEMKNQLGQLSLDLIELEGQKRENADNLAATLGEQVQLDQERNALQEQIHKDEASLNELSQEALKIKQQLLSIREMERNLSGYSLGAKSILSAGKKGELKGIMGLSGEVIDVPPGMEQAIEVAAGRGLENVIVETARQAEQAIDYLKTKHLGRVTFLPLDILKVSEVPDAVMAELSRHKQVLGLASKLVKCEDKYRRAIDYLLGRVVIVEDLKTGIGIFRSLSYPLRMVTLEGELINPGGAVTGGSRPRADNSSPLQRKAEEKKLMQALEKNEALHGQHQSSLQEKRSQLQSLESAGNSVKQRALELSYRQQILLKQIENGEHTSQSSRQEIEGYLDEMKDLDREIEGIGGEILATQLRLQQAEKENQDFAGELEGLKDSLGLRQSELALRRERLASWREQLTMKKTELDHYTKNIGQFKQVGLSYEESYQEACQLRERLQSECLEQEGRIEQLEGEIARNREELERMGDKVQAEENVTLAGQGGINQLRGFLHPLRTRIAELEGQTRNLEMGITRAEMELEALGQRWREKFHSDWVELEPPLLSSGEIRELKVRIDFLQEQIEALGSVDVEAIREYEELDQRFSFLTGQYQDLIAARDSLHSLLHETEKLMLKNFSQFMLLANQSFNQTFQEIFGGGEAVLKLEENKERLEAGIEIEVKLPGKRSQLLGLLSGGERALTCIAFIFSLLRLKPAPFCLLDEIDAALDEANLNRFARFLKDMATSMQFIVITHRQGTIEAGGKIHGVTMPEKGISSVFTLDLSEAENLAG